MAEYGDTAGWKKAPAPASSHHEMHMPHIPSRNTYVEIKVTSEEWWLITFQVWVLISFALITRAIMHNVVMGWHCPRNCDAFLTPFALCIATFVVPTCVCCPIMGAKGVWWCYIKRKSDDDEHRDIHRMRKKCCCISISWIPKKHPTNQKRNNKHHKPVHDSDSHLPSYVKPGTAHDMDRDPGSPGRKRQDGSIRLPPMTPRLAEIAKQTAATTEPQPVPEPEPEPQPQSVAFAGAVGNALDAAAREPTTARVAAAQRAVLTGPGQNIVDVGLETAPRPLTRERGATIDDMDRVGITASRRAAVPADTQVTAGGTAGQYGGAPMTLLAPAPAPAPATLQAPMALGSSNPMLLARPGPQQQFTVAGGRARPSTPPRLGSAADLRAPPMIPGMSQPAPQNTAAAHTLLTKFRANVNGAPPGGGGGGATMNL